MANSAVGVDGAAKTRSGFSRSGRVLLHEPERCWECGEVFLSLYPVTRCTDHEGTEKL